MSAPNSYRSEDLKDLGNVVATNRIRVVSPVGEWQLGEEAKLMLIDGLRALDGRHDGPQLPREPTMGMWDDFCDVYEVPFDNFLRAYRAMVDGLTKCPMPIQGDDGSQADCIAKGHCGCVYGTDAAQEGK